MGDPPSRQAARQQRSPRSPRTQFALGALVTVLALLPAWWQAGRWYESRLAADRRAVVAATLATHADTLTAALNRQFTVLRGLHAFLEHGLAGPQLDPNLDADFLSFAASLYTDAEQSGLVAIAAAPGGVVRYVFPLEHRPMLVGYDLHAEADPGLRADIVNAIESRHLVLSGPYPLGFADNVLIAHQALFSPVQSPDGVGYWGTVSVIIDLEGLLTQAGITEELRDLDLAVRNQHQRVVFGSAGIFAHDPVTASVTVSETSWELAAIPILGWTEALESAVLAFRVASALPVALAAALAGVVYSRQLQLSWTVKERTQALAQANARLLEDISVRKEAEARLAEKEQQYREIFEATGDGLIITALDGHIVAINPAACSMYGYRREEAVGQPLTMLIQTDYHALFSQMLERVKAGYEFVTQALDRRRDGTQFYVEVHGSSFTYGGQPHLLSVVRDITDRVRSMQLLEQRVQERTRELSTLLQVSRDMVSTLQLEPLLAQTLDRLRDVVAYDAATLLELDDDGSLTLLDYRGPRPRSDLPRHWDLREAEHIRMVLDHRQPLTIPNVHAGTPSAQAWQRSWGAPLGHIAEHTASWLGVPLMVKDRVIGTLTLEHAEPGHFTPLHAKLALAFANQVAVAMENARLYEESQRLGMIEERQRIARELHDSVSQALYSIGLGARTARALLDRDPQRAAEPIEYVLSLAEGGLAEMRALIFELRPDSLSQETLATALDRQVTILQSRYQLDIVVDFAPEPALPADVKEALYRVAHEALNNTVKHAQARHVRVGLYYSADTATLVVEDDGVGFDPYGSYPGHYGLQSMRERVERVGGRLTIESTAGHGVRVHADVPI